MPSSETACVMHLPRLNTERLPDGRVRMVARKGGRTLEAIASPAEGDSPATVRYRTDGGDWETREGQPGPILADLYSQLAFGRTGRPKLEPAGLKALNQATRRGPS